jgi:DNA repair and recombination protein RAD52
MSETAIPPFILRNKRIAHSRMHIDKKDVKIRQGAGGRGLSYAEAWLVIDHMNQVFGHDWSHTVTRLEKVDNGWLCVVRVTVVDHGSHDGVGWGNGADQEKAVKEAESDALKRACKNYGNFFGLSLYDRDHLEEMKKK